jgi:hypothetical protein
VRDEPRDWHGRWTLGGDHTPGGNVAEIDRKPAPSKAKVGTIAPKLKQIWDDRAVSSITAARDRVAQKYPNLRLTKIDHSKVFNPQEMAHTEFDAKGRRDPSIMFGMTTADYDATHRRYGESLANGYHPPAGPDNDIYGAITTHEMAHVMEANANNSSLRVQAQATLHDMWEREKPGTSFENWVSTEISGYALDANGAFYAPEALAEAFQDVEMNGSGASSASHALHKLLVEAHNHAS